MSTRFVLNQKVRIADRDAPGHVRTPVYARGKEGRIERVLPRFLDPEREAYGVNEGSETRLYRVRIKQSALWPDYDGQADDVLELEIYEHWLEQVGDHSDTEGR
ncbi:SH3-like domain-containing protein [Streptomyces sp. NPDC046716]|uniref:SH3-like domain-containing protein n=1 Tax=Streptomyces sp. NPDC046716 TaxID=3157093 RepID=UPI0033F03F11